MMSASVRLQLLVTLIACGYLSAFAYAEQTEELTRRIHKLEPNVMTAGERAEAVGMIQRDIRGRRDDANAHNRAEWAAIDSRRDWEKYRDVRIARLKASLGELPAQPEPPISHVTGVVEGEGFRIDNVVYESRPGMWVPGNLYVPAKPTKSMPGLLIVHSHHRDKTHGELQDMGMTWARAGCLVLVIDQVGYGERRAHPFNTQDDYAGDFKSWRQDYYYRYDSGVQLQLAGDSLMGWFVWDLMRGVDLLLSRDGVDPSRIIILGSVAGGGDPCAVTAALDNRIACVVPFNFGGLQPESYPLPENAEETFNFAMSSYWDTTRGLPRTCSDGFFHWTIVGSLAPRPMIYAHEFMWDREHDPVWKRFQRLYGDFYNKPDNLSFAVGKGSVRDSSDVATHCTHIGKYHRQFIHPAFKRWFGIEVESDDEYSKRVDRSALTCLTSKYREQLKPQGFIQLVSELGRARASAAQRRLSTQPSDMRREKLQNGWRQHLGPINPNMPQVMASTIKSEPLPAATIERLRLRTENGITVPLVLLAPATGGSSARGVVVGVSQTGKAAFLEERADQLASLLEAGFAVCLPDVRGTGETREGTSRGRRSGDCNRSVNIQMFGETILGQRIRDLRAVMRYLRTRDDIGARKIAIWGDSFVEPNPGNTDFNIPHDVARSPRQPEPLGGLLALFTALYEEDVDAVYIHRGLISFASVLDSAHVYLSHDATVPRALIEGDLAGIAASLGSTKLNLTSMVDGLNRRVAYDRTAKIYVSTNNAGQTTVGKTLNPAEWLIAALR